MIDPSVRRTLPVGRFNPSSRILYEWQLMTALWQRGFWGRFLARLLRDHIRRAYGCYISPSSRVGRAVFLPHPVALVIGDKAEVSDGATLYQGVTLGQDKAAGRCPKVGAGATIFAGAVLIGDISVGAGAIVGANAFVKASVGSRQVVAGVPARVIKQIIPQTGEAPTQNCDGAQT